MAQIELQLVQRFRDRHGKLRHYFRRPGAKRVPLPGLPGSLDFMAAYQAALAGVDVGASATSQAQKADSRTVSALICLYYRSNDFLSLQPQTQANYRNILDRFRVKHGSKSAVTLGTHHLEAIFHAGASTPGATRNLRKRLMPVFSLAVRLGWRKDNPVRESKPPKSKSDGHIAWSEEDIATFKARWQSGTKERLALELLLCLGQRRSDTCAMGRQHLVGADKIRLTSVKNKYPLIIRLHRDLRVELAHHGNAMTFILTEYGKPFTRAGFTNWFVAKAKLAGLHNRTPHGLRKSAGRRLAEAGCTAHQIMSVLGLRSLAEAERYTRAAGQERLADDAMDKLEAETRTSSVKPV
ncbi:tyrosine-type recombinase/integrase [Brevundimonas sp.]|uniref:tyrosine-type recombinase/integrase n=1 Tax=Brevundimonas sp. TaxID=1871086 RepID=UPI0028AB79B7|nr:tyrosine-type recombinase/integrase [Brevundimonas sp.]